MHVKLVPHPERSGHFTLTPYGPIDSDTYLDFREKIKSLFILATKGVVIDLENVEYISSAGLGVLFTLKKHCKQNGGDLIFCNLKPQIKRLFEIVNALPKETLFKDAAEADAYLYRMMNKAIDKDRGLN